MDNENNHSFGLFLNGLGTAITIFLLLGVYVKVKNIERKLHCHHKPKEQAHHIDIILDIPTENLNKQ
jgi:hypothetical protein